MATTGQEAYGYRRWAIAPETGVRLGLKRASAKVVTAFGGDLSVEWILRRGKMHVEIHAPVQTCGQFRYGDEARWLCGRPMYQFSVDMA